MCATSERRSGRPGSRRCIRALEARCRAWQVGGAALLLLLISLLVLRWRDRRYLFVGWFWFLGTLVPMIGLITVGEQAMADRYAYLPLIGLFIAVVWSIDALARERGIRSLWLGGAAAVVVLALGCVTYRQIGYWHDDETLWRYTLSVTEENYMAHNNLAIALAKAERPDEAVVEFRTATSLHKYPPGQVLALALYELRVGHPREAIEECQAALHDATDLRLRAAAWSGIGHAHLQLQQYDLAADSYQTALRLDPENGPALMGSGILALRQGQAGQAVAQLAHAVKADANDVNVLILAEALRRAGRTADADAAAAQVQKISPDPAQAQSDAQRWLSFAGLKPIF